eukprot:3124892-Prymnesium_polylepis.1
MHDASSFLGAKCTNVRLRIGPSNERGYHAAALGGTCKRNGTQLVEGSTHGRNLPPVETVGCTVERDALILPVRVREEEAPHVAKDHVDPAVVLQLPSR